MPVDEEDTQNGVAPVYYSQGGDTWNFLEEATLKAFGSKNYMRFRADHFTYFAI